VVVSGNQQTAKVFDVQTGKAKLTLTDGIKGHLLSVAFSPDGRLLATGLVLQRWFR
jgi:hypothetical protein